MEEDLSLKELVRKLTAWKDYFLSNWKVLVIGATIGVSIGLIKYFTQKKLYVAKLSFALEDKSGGGATPYAGLASQFGVDIGGGSNGAFSGDNLLELLRSRMMVEKTLFTPVTFEGKTDLLINRFIEVNKLRENWSKEPKYDSIEFKMGDDRESFSLYKEMMLNTVYGLLMQNDFSVSKQDKKLVIINVSFSSNDELFTKEFIEILTKNISDFYIETKTKKSRVNIELLTARVDSVKKELDREMINAALNKDQNTNVIRTQANVTSAKKQMNIQILSTMYAELIKNLELSKFTLMREEPLIQVIDKPRFPLQEKKLGIVLATVLGAFAGSFIVAVYLIYKRLKDILLG
jgi:hypothetical protein